MSENSHDSKPRRTMEEITAADSVHRRPVKPIEIDNRAPSNLKAPNGKDERDQETYDQTTDFGIEEPGTSTKFSLRAPVTQSFSGIEPASDDFDLNTPRSEAEVFYPLHRPKTPVLYMMDDNQESAEAFRLRSMQTVIGRSRGDILICNDPHVSERHAEIRRELKGNQVSWFLNDLKSTNGSYVQILKQNLVEGDCLLLGSRYFRFSQVESDSAGGPRHSLVQFALASNETRRIYMLDPNKTNMVGNKQPWPEEKTWDDKFLDHEHAKIVCDQSNQWHIEDQGSVNGIWIQFNSLALSDGISFQLGGQRFTFCIES